MTPIELNTEALEALVICLSQSISFFVGALTAIAFTIAAGQK